jgi:hypothetical protein
MGLSTLSASLADASDMTRVEQLLTATSVPVVVHRIDLGAEPAADGAREPEIRSQAVQARSLTSGEWVSGLAFGPFSSVNAGSCYLDPEQTSRLATVIPTLEAEANRWGAGDKREAFYALHEKLRVEVRFLPSFEQSSTWTFRCGERAWRIGDVNQLKSQLAAGLEQLSAWREE